MKKSFRENPDDLFDTEMRQKALEQASSNYEAELNDEGRAGVSSADESIVSNYIRKRIEVPEDRLHGASIFKKQSVEAPPDEYAKELDKLKQLTREQLRDLLDEVEEKSREGRGLYSKGELLHGYAIDPFTLESHESEHHSGLDFILATEIYRKMVEEDKPIDDISIEDIQFRIVKGLIYLKVPGFKTPIVKLWLGIKEMGNEVSEENRQKITKHLKGERKFLPIRSDNTVL